MTWMFLLVLYIKLFLQDLLNEAKKIEFSVQSVDKTGKELINKGAEAGFAKEIKDSISLLLNKWDTIIKKRATEYHEHISDACQKINQVSRSLLNVIVRNSQSFDDCVLQLQYRVNIPDTKNLDCW